VTVMDHAWISIVAAIDALLVALQSIYRNYRLFLASATGDFKFKASMGCGAGVLKSFAPRLAFALFGAIVAFWTVYQLLPHQNV
jgi:hypothetical protein